MVVQSIPPELVEQVLAGALQHLPLAPCHLAFFQARASKLKLSASQLSGAVEDAAWLAAAAAFR